MEASVPRAARGVAADWAALARGSEAAEPFRTSMLDGLPEPARRWLTHAIAPGTPLWQTVELRMSGTIRLGAWRSFTADQVLSPPHGFIWAASARLLGVPVNGFDRLSSGTGQMRWRLGGLIPVVAARGADVTRSAAGRLAGEGVLLPTAFPAATWASGVDADQVVATWAIAGEDERAVLRIGPGGRLVEVTMQRWGNPDGAPFGRYPFGVAIQEEQTFSGVTIGSTFRAGWWWGTERQAEGEFFRARITDARFR